MGKIINFKRKALCLLLVFLMLVTAFVPVLGGMTEREAKAVITAPMIKVGSFNIKNAMGGSTIDAIANQIRNYGLDVVGLQEVDYYTGRCYLDTMAALASRLGYYYAYFPTISFDGGQYGIGTLSRWPIISTSSKGLTYSKERRILSKSVIQTDSGYQFNFYNTHLDTVDTARYSEMQEIVATMKEPYFLVGDFNCAPSTQDNYISTADNVSAITSAHRMVTYQSGSQIDNIYASANNFSISNPGVVTNGLSDHYMIYATAYATPTKLEGNMPVSVGENPYIKFKNAGNGEFITANANGNIVSAPNDDINTNAIWKVKRHANNVYTLENYAYGSMLDVDNYGDTDGSKLHLWENNGQAAQQFYIYYIDEKYVLRPIYTASNQVIDLDASNGKVQTWGYWGGDSQKFSLIKIGFEGGIPLNLGDKFEARITNVATGLNLAYESGDTLFKDASGDKTKWQFIRYAYNAYKIKNVNSGKFLYLSDSKTEGTSVVMSDTGSKFYVYMLNNHFILKATSGTYVFDMDATNKDVNIYSYSATDELKLSAQQFDIKWYSAEDFTIADIGESGTAYIKNFRQDKFLSYNSDKLVNSTDDKTTLFKYQKNSDGSYTFTVSGKKLALDVVGAGVAIGTRLQVYESNGSDAQKFFLYTAGDGYFYLKPAHTGKVLDMMGEGFVQLYGINRTMAQCFRFIDENGDRIRNNYIVTYKPAGGSGEPEAQIKKQGKDLKLSNVIPVKDGYDFVGWSTTKGAQKAEYKAGGGFTVDADTTLYAVWKVAGTPDVSEEPSEEPSSEESSEIEPDISDEIPEELPEEPSEEPSEEHETITHLALSDLSELVMNENELLKIKANTSADYVISQFVNAGVVVKDYSGSVVADSDYVGTGFNVELIINGETVDSCVIIIKGDVDGDGKITSTDYLKIKSHFIGLSVIEDVYLTSSDVDVDGKITSTDYLKIKSYFLGLSELYE